MNKIFLYGNGILSATIQGLLDKNKVELIGIVVDKEYWPTDYQGDELLISPEELIKYEFDYIVIASNFYEEMKGKLLRSGISDKKIIATDIHQSKIYKNFIEQVRIDFEKCFNQLKLNEFLISSIYEPINLVYKNPSNQGGNNTIHNSDYVRYATLELTARRINEAGIKGEVAEVGVYKGDFSAYINQLFPNKTLFLFDTFEGFPHEDLDVENQFGFSKHVNNQFSDTSVELVLKKMKNPENCVVKKGYFPETASDVDCKFAFVSLDADLYQPIYDGLQYFYPRLSQGGAIFIHDYLNGNFKGVKAATDKFCNEQKLTIQILSDFYGTAVLVK